MNLKEQGAYFLRITELSPRKLFSRVESLAEAQGVVFLCPKCFIQNGGPVGTHSVICWFRNRGVPEDVDPSPGRWNPSGTGIEDLTFVGPGQTSVWLFTTGSCGWHGHIVNGEATLN